MYNEAIDYRERDDDSKSVEDSKLNKDRDHNEKCEQDNNSKCGETGEGNEDSKCNEDRKCNDDGKPDYDADTIRSEGSDEENVNSILADLHDIFLVGSSVSWDVMPQTFQTMASSALLEMVVPEYGSFLTVSFVCQPTGSGKTHIVRMFGSCRCGIIIYLTPCLSLGADQVEKFVSEHDNTTASIHFDEIDRIPNASQQIAEATLLLESVNVDDEVFYTVIASPQSLARPHWKRSCIDVPLDKGTLAGVVVDEVQLFFVSFGCHFWPEFPALKSLLFDKLILKKEKIAEDQYVKL